jgi:hypothetical protein
MEEYRYHVKFSSNSTNNFNYKETSPELIAGEQKTKTKITTEPTRVLFNTIFILTLCFLSVSNADFAF